nr:hypothetical protein [Tanacetum cinerariifolium]
MILESVENGPLNWTTIKENGVTRIKKYAELSVAEKIQADCDMKAANIILQGFTVLVFSPKDAPIACLNKAMDFLMTVASSRQGLLNATTIKVRDIWLGNALSLSNQEMQHDPGVQDDQAVQKIIPNNVAFQTKDLDTYNDVSNAKSVLMDNISNYGSDVILEDFGKCFVPQQEMSADEVFWYHMLNHSTKFSGALPVKIKAPKELPKVSLVNESLKKLNIHLANFDKVVKIRTTPNAQTKVDKQCLEIAKKELLLEIDRLLHQIMSQDVLLTVMNSMSLNDESVNMERKRNESCDKCFNLAVELLKSQNAHNDLLKSAKKVAVTSKNKVKKVRFAKPLTSSRNIKQVESSTISYSNTPVLSPTGLKYSTSNYRSKPTCNKKNDRISRTPSRNMNNKVEAQPRKVNKKNRVVEPIRDVDVKLSLLNANSIYATCKKSMFDGVHDINMNPTQAQQKALDDALVAPVDRLEFRKCDMRLGIGYIKSRQNRRKTDKTRHGNKKSSRNQSRSALNSKLLSINLKSQRLDKEKQEVKNIVEHAPKRKTHLTKCLKNFKVIHTKNSTSLNNMSQISSVITNIPNLPTKEPDYSLSMGDDHLSTIPKTESNEVIKSSVENLVPIPSEFEDFSDNENECDVLVCDDFMTFSDPLFDSNNDFTSSDDKSLSNEDILIIYSNLLFDDEEIISTKIDPHYFNARSNLLESLLNRDTFIDSSPKFDYLLEEFSGELAHIDPIPPGIKEADFNLEEEIRLVENLLYDNSSPRPPEELNVEIALESLSPSHIPVEDKPPDVEVFFDFEPDTGVLTAKVVEDISEHYVLMPKVLPSQPTLCPNIDTLLLFSSKNEDRVFKPGILSYLLVSHREKITSDFSKNKMMMYGEDIPLLDVSYLHFYPP